MACFLVPLAEAVVVSAVEQGIKAKQKQAKHNGAVESGAPAAPRADAKLGVLSGLLYGGSALLAFEHLWHGEIVPYSPFLTAAKDPLSTAEMLHEMATVGVAMAAVITLVWAGVLLLGRAREKRACRGRIVNRL